MRSALFRCYIGIGSNLGPSTLFFEQALAKLKESDSITLVAHSKWYKTTPVDCLSDRLFLNGVIAIDTTLSLPLLFARLEEIERLIGKVAKAKNAPRILDLDLLFYGSAFHSDQKITIPHPQWHRRLFVIKPLSDLTSSITLSTEGFSLLINIPKMVSFLTKEKEEKVVPSDETS